MEVIFLELCTSQTLPVFYPPMTRIDAEVKGKICAQLRN